MEWLIRYKLHDETARLAAKLAPSSFASCLLQGCWPIVASMIGCADNSTMVGHHMTDAVAERLGGAVTRV